MAAQRGSPAWYAEAGEDVSHSRYGTEAALGVIAEARSLIFQGQTLDAVKKVIAARGAKGRSEQIVSRAARQEWDAVVKAASTDVDAGETSTQPITMAKRLAMEVARTDMKSTSFSEALAGYGASEKLAALLARDPQVRRTGMRAGALELALGAGAIVIGLFMLTTYSSSGQTIPVATWFIMFIGLGAVGRGFSVMNRK
jgi:hypothetical protein